MLNPFDQCAYQLRQKFAERVAQIGIFKDLVMVERERPVGPIVPFNGAQLPNLRPLQGDFVHLEALDAARHGPDLWAHMKAYPFLWDYLFEESPKTEIEFLELISEACAKADWKGYAICLPGGGAVGYAHYLNIMPAMGSIEVGNINFSPALQRSPAASEAMYLMMREAFTLGYRRYEWKCNALNMPSRRAAQRLGFSWEGIFRQHMMVKSRNRDTAWFAMTDQDWPALKVAFQTWLSAENFNDDGAQKQSLRALTSDARVAGDPAQE